MKLHSLSSWRWIWLNWLTNQWVEGRKTSVWCRLKLLRIYGPYRLRMIKWGQELSQRSAFNRRESLNLIRPRPQLWTLTILAIQPNKQYSMRLNFRSLSSIFKLCKHSLRISIIQPFWLKNLAQKTLQLRFNQPQLMVLKMLEIPLVRRSHSLRGSKTCVNRLKPCNLLPKGKPNQPFIGSTNETWLWLRLLKLRWKKTKPLSIRNWARGIRWPWVMRAACLNQKQMLVRPTSRVASTNQEATGSGRRAIAKWQLGLILEPWEDQ